MKMESHQSGGGGPNSQPTNNATLPRPTTIKIDTKIELPKACQCFASWLSSFNPESACLTSSFNNTE